MSTERDCGSELIAPDGKSGFSNEDVLAEAEEGDEVYIEFGLAGEDGVYGVTGDVSQVSGSKLEDGRTELRTISMESEHNIIEWFKLRLLVDTKSAHNSLKDKVQVLERGKSHGANRGLDSVHTIEVTKR